MNHQPTTPAAPRRRRGGQPGNLNALKHGFYASRFRQAELTALETSHFTGLADEIALLRLYIRRVIELGASHDDLDASLNLLRNLCLAGTTLTRMIKTDHYLSGGSGDFNQAVKSAIEDIAAELRIIGQSTPPPADRE